MKQLVGKVKKNPSKDWKGAEGLSLIVLQMNLTDKNLIVIRPIKLGEIESFYKISFESLKDTISSDYEYFIWYLLNDDYELTCTIEINDLEDIRQATEEDIKEHNANAEEFKKIYKYYERQEQIRQEELEEEKAAAEFEKADKIEITVLNDVRENIEVSAVIYKGFGVHDLVGYVPGSSKTVTILEGAYKGMKLTNCNISEYKELIDTIREAIGDKIIGPEDTKTLVKIVQKY